MALPRLRGCKMITEKQLINWSREQGFTNEWGFLTFDGLDAFREYCPDGTLWDLYGVLNPDKEIKP